MAFSLICCGFVSLNQAGHVQVLSAEYVSFSPRLFEHLKSVVDMHILFEKLTPLG